MSPFRRIKIKPFIKSFCCFLSLGIEGWAFRLDDEHRSYCVVARDFSHRINQVIDWIIRHLFKSSDCIDGVSFRF